MGFGKLAVQDTVIVEAASKEFRFRVCDGTGLAAVSSSRSANTPSRRSCCNNKAEKLIGSPTKSGNARTKASNAVMARFAYPNPSGPLLDACNLVSGQTPKSLLIWLKQLFLRIVLS